MGVTFVCAQAGPHPTHVMTSPANAGSTNSVYSMLHVSEATCARSMMREHASTLSGWTPDSRPAAAGDALPPGTPFLPFLAAAAATTVVVTCRLPNPG